MSDILNPVAHAKALSFANAFVVTSGEKDPAEALELFDEAYDAAYSKYYV